MPYIHYNIIVPVSPVSYFLPINVMVICLSPLSTRVSESPGKHVGHNTLIPPFNPDKERSLVLSVPLQTLYWCWHPCTYGQLFPGARHLGRNQTLTVYHTVLLN